MEQAIRVYDQLRSAVANLDFQRETQARARLRDGHIISELEMENFSLTLTALRSFLRKIEDYENAR